MSAPHSCLRTIEFFVTNTSFCTSILNIYNDIHVGSVRLLVNLHGRVGDRLDFSPVRMLCLGELLTQSEREEGK